MTKDRRYWDSDAFLAWLQAEQGRVEACESVLAAAEDGRVLIVTSALTLAEVLYLRGRERLPKERKEKVVNFFKSEYIAVRNVTRSVAESARELVWEYGIKPKDAIHVATALDARLELLNTFDGGLIKHSGRIGSPPLRIGKPNLPYQRKLPFTKR